jgi:hypothetical protein
VSRDSLPVSVLTWITQERGKRIVVAASRVDVVYERGACTIRRFDGDVFLGPSSSR